MKVARRQFFRKGNQKARIVQRENITEPKHGPERMPWMKEKKNANMTIRDGKLRMDHWNGKHRVPASIPDEIFNLTCVTESIAADVFGKLVLVWYE